ncbi:MULTISPECIES: hypothetical protein [Burkholderia cepacia complex]|nr:MULTISPECIES: hypothetical protein [Burkholderia cepacia complex]MBJ9731906.1 hypothetical protein [Burkholderia cenocepacia]MBR8397096.1 hypothetical protein [Burkholderia cenocepacia]MDN7530617.1 hypothetical protein [Burkholderia orbicola]MDN7615267.1 hypothetical protein [Burkholderia cepacia]UJH76586.1 hypothetical protein L0U95_17835 [Burkholderia cenocepacia]
MKHRMLLRLLVALPLIASLGACLLAPVGRDDHHHGGGYHEDHDRY